MGIKILPVIFVVLISCIQSVSFTSLQGTFTGRIPCADCPGINVHLTLRGDSVYNLLWQYLERNVEFSDSGKWGIIESNGDKIILLDSKSSHQKTYYLIDNVNNIEMLGNNKKELITVLTIPYIEYGVLYGPDGDDYD